VDHLEPDDKIRAAQVLALQRAAPVAGQVDSVRTGELDRFRERRQRPQPERPVRADVDVGVAGSVAQHPLRERTPEAVARADEDGFERLPSPRDGVALVDPVEVRQTAHLTARGNPQTGGLRTSPLGTGRAVYAHVVAGTTRPRARIGVPFVDLTLDDDLMRQILDDIAGIVERAQFTNGPQVPAFEGAFAEFCGAAHCVGVASGLDALRLGLVAAGVEPGDEVVVPAHTFAATLEAVVQAGARPLLADVSDTDFCLDPDGAEATITARTRFVLPVHLYGRLADMEALERVAERHGVAIVEDACQAHGAVRDGRRAGTAGVAAAFSFYPTKNLGAFGDAGALVTGDRGLAARVRALREHGQRRKYEHSYQGYTARLDTIQAAVLLRKLGLLEHWNDDRRGAARFYDERLAGVGDLVLPTVTDASAPVWHLYVVRTAHPDQLASFLAERGIGTGRHYPQPLHLAPAYAGLGYGRGAFPVAERLAAEVLSLPIFPGITEAQLSTVVDAIRDYFRRG
jgi:dTDP-4-amino-4,6-dideoxygalactose transaminase